MFQTHTFTTTTVQPGDVNALDVTRTIGPNHLDVLKVLVVPSAGTGSSRVQMFNKTTRADADRVWGVDPISGDIFVPMELEAAVGVPVERNEGFVVPFLDLDAAGQMGFRFYNEDTVAKTYTVTVIYREREQVTLAGLWGIGRVATGRISEQFTMPNLAYVGAVSQDGASTIKVIGLNASNQVSIAPGLQATVIGGQLQVGSSALTNELVRISGTPVAISNNAVLLRMAGTFGSDSTSHATVVASQISVAAASFSIGELIHFRVINPTFGAGASAAVQEGFYCEDLTTATTTAFGFRGALTAGSGKYNLYMDGTAQNYLGGILEINTNPSSVAAGLTAGLGVRVGPSGSSNTNPPVGAPVAGFFYINSTNLNAISGATMGLTSVNGIVEVVSGADAFACGLEANIDNSGTEVSSVYSGLAKVGFRSVNSNTKRITAHFSGDSQSTGAVPYYGMAITATSNAMVFVPGRYASWSITQSITSSGSPQTVTTNYNSITQNGLHIGQSVSIDTGGSQEDVVILAIGAGASATITAVFAKNHASPSIYPYPSPIGIDFGSAVFASSVFRIGSIQEYATSATGALLGFTVNDSAGVQRTYDYFTAGNVHVSREVGGYWQWEDKNATALFQMDSSSFGPQSAKDNALDAGKTNQRFRSIYVGTSIINSGFGQFAVMAAPGTGGASTVRLYADTSGGKVRLMAIFPSGAAQQIAVEP